MNENKIRKSTIQVQIVVNLLLGSYYALIIITLIPLALLFGMTGITQLIIESGPVFFIAACLLADALFLRRLSKEAQYTNLLFPYITLSHFSFFDLLYDESSFIFGIAGRFILLYNRFILCSTFPFYRVAVKKTH